jgi:hypothetical protein
MHRIVKRIDPVHRDYLEFPVVGKPKWMRWATFSRHYARWERANEQRDQLFEVKALRILARPHAGFAVPTRQ